MVAAEEAEEGAIMVVEDVGVDVDVDVAVIVPIVQTTATTTILAATILVTAATTTTPKINSNNDDNLGNHRFPIRRRTEKREPMLTPFPRRPGFNLLKF